jgi:hypothetical protein
MFLSISGVFFKVDITLSPEILEKKPEAIAGGVFLV